MTKPDKARVRHAFERAAASYDSAADVQRRICDQLLTQLPAMQPARLLDAGCGTGYALPALAERFPAAEILALDFAPAMLQKTGAGHRRLAGDLEQLPLASASLDFYWSSLAVQWCDLAKVLNEACRVLRPGAHLALATLGPATFGELRHAFANVDDHAHTLNFHSADTVGQLAAAAGLRTVNIEQSTEIAHYPDLRCMLKAVKAVGANQLGDGRRTSLLGRAAFARAEAACAGLRTSDGLPLTYDVIFLNATR